VGRLINEVTLFFATAAIAALANAKLAYKTYGKLNAAKDNVVVVPTFYTGNHTRNEGFFGDGRAIDPAHHFIVSINMFGNGISSSPFCASAKTAEHNWVFLEGVKAALQADAVYDNGNYQTPPANGLKAFGRVYAGWAFSQDFFREKLYREKGFDTAEDLLRDWEQDHLSWDANDLLCKLSAWQHGDISQQAPYDGDFRKALSAISARTIVIACNNDLYFRPEDNAFEVKHIPNSELRIYQSAWGHCVASPGNDPEFHRYLDQALRELLG